MPKTQEKAPVASYPLRVQASRAKGRNVRFFVYIPMPLAAALGVEGGEEVSGDLLDRKELHLGHAARPQRAVGAGAEDRPGTS
jgi:hypothetical protein